MSSMSTSSTIAMRAATTDSDERIVHKLALLDSAADPAGPVVIALVDGRPVAAASLVDGHVVADPFEPTADVVELLQARVAASARSAARPAAAGSPSRARGSRRKGSRPARKGSGAAIGSIRPMCAGPPRASIAFVPTTSPEGSPSWSTSSPPPSHPPRPPAPR